MSKLTINEMKAMHEAKGGHWFEEGAMSFFNTTIETQPTKNNIFITSEYMDDPSDKKFSLRKFCPDTCMVDTLGDFREFDTITDARKARSSYKGDK
jgi:hypothetical protein